MSLRLEFVMLASQDTANVRELCRRFGVSPTTGYKWLERFQAQGVEGLAECSRRPLSSPRQTPGEVARAVVQLRREHPAWGGRKLRRVLQDRGSQSVPAASTITDILRRHDLLAFDGASHVGPFARFERPAPNQLWQLDFKGHFPLANGRCHPLTALDDHSRFNIILEACADERQSTVRAALIRAFERYGMPDAILCDNGAPWGAGGEGHTALSVWCLRLGIGVYHGRAYHPQTQGKEERFHRTLKAEVIQRGGWRDCPHVQSNFQQWRPVYNCQRPHEALDMQTPASRYQPSQRAFPQSLPPVEYDEGVLVRKVDVAGRISFQGKPLKIGTAFHAQPVGIRQAAQEHCVEVIFGSHIIKTINLQEENL